MRRRADAIAEGLVMAASSQKVAATFSPQVVEAVAIYRGLQLAVVSGLTPCMLESDAKVVIKWINDATPLCSEIGNVISDILVLQHLAQCVSIRIFHRKANHVAHVLVKNNISCVEDMFWLEKFPPCIGALITNECRGCL